MNQINENYKFFDKLLSFKNKTNLYCINIYDYYQ